MVVGGGWCSQRLLSLNPTTVMVVLLLGLWLLLGCDKKDRLEILENKEINKKSDENDTSKKFLRLGI